MSVQRNRKNQRGQIIVIAVAVMFLLAFIAGLFLTLISRNIGRTQRGSDVLQAQYLAEAGIRYADEQLTHSALGADWRPDPPISAAQGDPDYEFLKNGYTRFNQGNGRFLLRVSYQPVPTYNNPDDPNDASNGLPLDANNKPTSDRMRAVYPPLGKYLKIESIGRRGIVDENDPTTWRDADPLRRQLVAYKPIGITDYARYETNKDRSDNTMVLGSFPFTTPNGDNGGSSNFRTVIYGPVRANGDLMWTGLDSIVLNAAERQGTAVGSQYSMSLTGDALPVGVNRQDNVAVAGRIFHQWPLDPKSPPADQVRLEGYAFDTGTGTMVTTTTNVKPSDDSAFTTAGGAYRDAAAGQGSEGKVRGVARLEPPMMDEAEPSTGVLRYRLITRNSGIVPPGKNFNIGQNGLGSGIYIDNNNEIQKDNQYRRLTDEWSQPGTGREVEALPGSAWRQNLYTPPGAEIYLDPTPSADINKSFPADQSQGTIVITRHDGKSWRDETGHIEGYTRRYRYPLRQVFDNSGNIVDTEKYEEANPVDPYRDVTGAYKTFQNGVIFLEGNVRVQGKLPADWRGPNKKQVRGQHLTIVTMGTAYIEGNLLKGDAASGDVNQFGTGVQMSGITIIAHDYVCVNTSAYFMRQPQTGAWNFALGNPYTELASPGEQFITSGFSAVNPDKYPQDARGNTQNLLVLQTAENYPGGAAMLESSGYDANGNQVAGSFFGDANGDPVPMTVTPGASASNLAENIWEHMSLSVDPVVPYPAGTPVQRTPPSFVTLGRPMPDWYALTYRPFFGPSPYGIGSEGAEFTQSYNQPLWISRVALSPMDIRIEAVLYAQEGSFFVMPGEWLNSNPNDMRDAGGPNSSRRYSDPVGAGWRTNDLLDIKGKEVPSVWPFYGEPPDVRVVINGAIAENLPADQEYQTAWSKHWGWTPLVRPDGSDSGHAGEGLVYMYDQDLRIPQRFDRYNRPLPPTPALPVSPDLVFFGEAA